MWNAEYTLPSVVQKFSEYKTLLSSAMDSAYAFTATTKSATINVGAIASTLQAYYSSVVSEKLMKSIGVKYGSLANYVDLLSNTTISDIITLDKNSSTTSFEFEFNPKLTLRNLDLGFFKLDDLDVDFKVHFKIDLTFNENDGSVSIVPSFKSIDFEFTKQIDSSKPISLGLFKADVNGGVFKFSVGVQYDNNNGFVFDTTGSSAELTYNTIGLKCGSATLAYLDSTIE